MCFMNTVFCFNQRLISASFLRLKTGQIIKLVCDRIFVHISISITGICLSKLDQLSIWCKFRLSRTIFFWCWCSSQFVSHYLRRIQDWWLDKKTFWNQNERIACQYIDTHHQSLTLYIVWCSMLDVCCSIARHLARRTGTWSSSDSRDFTTIQIYIAEGESRLAQCIWPVIAKGG